MSERLNYTKSKLKKNDGAIDFIPLAIALLQTALASLAFFGSLLEFPPDIRTLELWYENAGRLWLHPGCLFCMYLIGSVIVVLGAVKLPLRQRAYITYCALVLISVAVTELALMLISSWPGERRFRSILLHNVRTDLTDTENFWRYPYVIAILNPAFWFLIARLLFRRLPVAFRSTDLLS